MSPTNGSVSALTDVGSRGRCRVPTLDHAAKYGPYRRTIDPLRLYTSTPLVACVCASAVIAALLGAPVVGLAVVAFMSGWGELDGRCGMSHIGALTPLWDINPNRNRIAWLKALPAYTIGGTITAFLVGTLISKCGLLTHAYLPVSVAGMCAIGVCVALVLRELLFSDVRLPQVNRQTRPEWVMIFGSTTAAGMWGAHIGLGFATVISHGGIFPISVAILAFPDVSPIVFVCFWLGRTCPLWLAPATDARDVSVILWRIVDSGRELRRSSVLTHSTMAIVIGLIVIASFVAGQSV